MTNRVITRARGVIPGCRAPGPDSHMAVDRLGRLWTQTPPSGVALRSDLAPEQRAEALRIEPIGFASAGAKRKPKAAIAA
jgi:hypothetical protein